MKTPALTKSKYTTEAPLTHRWQRRKKTQNSLLHFWVLNLKNFSMNPDMMVSQEQTMMNSHYTTQQVSFIFGCSKSSPDFKTAVYFL